MLDDMLCCRMESTTPPVLDGENIVESAKVVLFSRITDIPIDSTVFTGSSLILNMSTKHVEPEMIYGGAQGKRGAIVRSGREATNPADVVLGVLKVTHKDLGEQLLDGLVATVNQEYPEFHELDSDYTSGMRDEIFHSKIEFEETDLIRGINAFSEAATDTYGRMYDATILEPAMRFAQRLIVLESN